MELIFFSIFLNYILLLFTVQSTGLRVEIKRMKPLIQKMAEMNIHPSRIESLFNVNKDANTSFVPLNKFLDSEFYGEVLIGHPGQKFNVIFDTTWSNSWVPSKLCSVTDIPCRIHNQYDCSTSSTYIENGKDFNVSIGSSHLFGRLSTDLIHIGQVNITNQTFAEIISFPWVFTYLKADGVLGLAFDSYAIDDATPFFYNMLKQGTIKKPIFSFYMNRDPSTSKAGHIYFGGVEKKHYRGNFTYIQLSKVGYWQFHMDSIKITMPNQDHIFCKEGCDVIADTSSMKIQGPKNEIYDINLLIKARPFYFNRFLVDCGTTGTLPYITFNINGRPFTLKPRDYIQKASWGGVVICMSCFTTAPDYVNTWTLGASFLSRFYVTFDMEAKRVGFADAR